MFNTFMYEYNKILEYFFNEPYLEIHLRELSRRLNLSASATKKYLDLMVKEGLLIETKYANTRNFKANTQNLVFKHLKIAHNLKFLKDLRLIDKILDKHEHIQSIMLYGSFAKGLNDKNSDIDLVIISPKKVFIEDSKVSVVNFTLSDWKKQLKDNKSFYQEVIVYGICLFGEVPVL